MMEEDGGRPPDAHSNTDSHSQDEERLIRETMAKFTNYIRSASGYWTVEFGKRNGLLKEESFTFLNDGMIMCTMANDFETSKIAFTPECWESIRLPKLKDLLLKRLEERMPIFIKHLSPFGHPINISIPRANIPTVIEKVSIERGTMIYDGEKPKVFLGDPNNVQLWLRQNRKYSPKESRPSQLPFVNGNSIKKEVIEEPINIPSIKNEVDTSHEAPTISKENVAVMKPVDESLNNADSSGVGPSEKATSNVVNQPVLSDLENELIANGERLTRTQKQRLADVCRGEDLPDQKDPTLKKVESKSAESSPRENETDSSQDQDARPRKRGRPSKADIAARQSLDDFREETIKKSKNEGTALNGEATVKVEETDSIRNDKEDGDSITPPPVLEAMTSTESMPTLEMEFTPNFDNCKPSTSDNTDGANDSNGSHHRRSSRRAAPKIWSDAYDNGPPIVLKKAASTPLTFSIRPIPQPGPSQSEQSHNGAYATTTKNSARAMKKSINNHLPLEYTKNLYAIHNAIIDDRSTLCQEGVVNRQLEINAKSSSERKILYMKNTVLFDARLLAKDQGKLTFMDLLYYRPLGMLQRPQEAKMLREQLRYFYSDVINKEVDGSENILSNGIHEIPKIERQKIRDDYLSTDFSSCYAQSNVFYESLLVEEPCKEWAKRPIVQPSISGVVVSKSGRALSVADKSLHKFHSMVKLHNHKELRIGDVVWAKFQNDYWPGIVNAFISASDLEDAGRGEKRTDVVWIRWVSDSTFNYVCYGEVFHFDMYFTPLYQPYKNDKHYSTSVAEAIDTMGRIGYFEKHITNDVYSVMVANKYNLTSIPENELRRIQANSKNLITREQRDVMMKNVIEKEINHFNLCYKTLYSGRNSLKWNPGQEQLQRLVVSEMVANGVEPEVAQPKTKKSKTKERKSTIAPFHSINDLLNLDDTNLLKKFDRAIPMLSELPLVHDTPNEDYSNYDEIVTFEPAEDDLTVYGDTPLDDIIGEFVELTKGLVKKRIEQQIIEELREDQSEAKNTVTCRVAPLVVLDFEQTVVDESCTSDPEILRNHDICRIHIIDEMARKNDHLKATNERRLAEQQSARQRREEEEHEKRKRNRSSRYSSTEDGMADIPTKNNSPIDDNNDSSQKKYRRTSK